MKIISKPIISVIVPVYNSEKFIKKCIDSILNQTFQNFELILVNDESKDNSLEILNGYSKNDNRIIVIDQKNTGPGLARNAGLKIARGKYVMFIDSDDYIDEDYIEKHFTKIKNDKLDIVVSGFKKVDNNGNILSFERKLKNGEFAKYVVMGPVSKIYRKDFLDKYSIQFTDTCASEDIQFNIKAFNSGAKVDTIPYVGYNYVYNENSVSNTIHKDFDEKLNMIEFLNSINYKTISNVKLNQYFIVRHCVSYLLYGGKSASKKSFLNEYKKLFIWIDKNIYKKNKYFFLKPKGELRNVHFIVLIFTIIHKLHLMNLFAKIYCRG